MGLTGKTIVITRAVTQASELRTELERRGARVIECPTIEFAPPDDWTLVDAAIQRLDTYQWLVLTSKNAVDHFFPRVELAGVRCSVPIAVVGPSTETRLKRWKLRAAVVPRDFSAEGLLSALPANLHGVRILFPRAEDGRELLPEELRNRGAVVDVVTVYRTTKTGQETLARILASEQVDCIVFASPSSIPSEPAPALKGLTIAVIGPVTRMAALAAGLEPAIEPEQATIPHLASAIERYFSAR